MAARAQHRYLERHIEPGLPPCPLAGTPWDHVLVIPAFHEEAALVERLCDLPTGDGSTLVILVLNRPAKLSEPDDNHALREAVSLLPAGSAKTLKRLTAAVDLYLHDLDLLSGPLPRNQAVGLARKTGCDIAFKWKCDGAITSHWICSTDADARLPDDYFSRLEQLPPNAVAATYPFWHAPGRDASCNLSSALYELRLHHYVLGLEYAGSPYAFYTLGSCLAVTADAYATVRGFPKRAGGEDFYLLNKLAKTGEVVKLAGDCIQLESRESHRVPFGTGPAVARISAQADPRAHPLFYHPACFEAVRAVLRSAPRLACTGLQDLPELLCSQHMDPALADACHAVLDKLGTESAIEHCRRQGKSPQQFMRQFHQWFDGFKTLKFIHAIRELGWPDCSLAGLDLLHPELWPTPDNTDVEKLRRGVCQHRRWVTSHQQLADISQ